MVSTESMGDSYRWQRWFIEQWSRAAMPCAVVVFVLLPVLVNDENRPLLLLVTLLPVYMIHQYAAARDAGGGREACSIEVGHALCC